MVRRFATLTFALVLATVAGCAAYRIGTQSLYPPDIRTVYVPMFQSDSYRRGMGERLTEAVMKQIEAKTPFKVVGTPDADSILSGRIITETKGVTVEAPTDEPRALLITLVVEVAWIDRRGDMLRPPGSIPVETDFARILQNSNQYPEIGQSITTADQQAIEELAEQIVGLMEVPW